MLLSFLSLIQNLPQLTSIQVMCICWVWLNWRTEESEKFYGHICEILLTYFENFLMLEDYCVDHVLVSFLLLLLLFFAILSDYEMKVGCNYEMKRKYRTMKTDYSLKG